MDANHPKEGRKVIDSTGITMQRRNQSEPSTGHSHLQPRPGLNNNKEHMSLNYIIKQYDWLSIDSITLIGGKQRKLSTLMSQQKSNQKLLTKCFSEII